MPAELTLYRDLLADIKTRVRQAQHRAALSANAEMLLLYWDIGASSTPAKNKKAGALASSRASPPTSKTSCRSKKDFRPTTSTGCCGFIASIQSFFQFPHNPCRN